MQARQLIRLPALALVQRQVPNQALPIILIRDEPRLLHPGPGILLEELIRERHLLAAHAILPTLLVEIFVVEELAPPHDHGDPEARPRRRGQDAALQRLDRGAQLLELLPARVEGRFQACPALAAPRLCRLGAGWSGLGARRFVRRLLACWRRVWLGGFRARL